MLAAIVFVLAVFSLMSDTDIQDVYLNSSDSDAMGWRWEVSADGHAAAQEPAFLDEYTGYLPAEAANAIRGVRTLTETLPSAVICMHVYGIGIEFFLDGETLYSDFQGGARDADGFLSLEPQACEALRDRAKTVAVSLPEDYAGKELAVVFYYPEPQKNPSLLYPTLCNHETVYAPMVVSSVKPVAAATLCALMALLVAGLFVLDSIGGEPDWRTLLIVLYFLLLFADQAGTSAPGMVSLLNSRFDLRFLSGLYMAPMYLYLALRLPGWKRYALSAATCVWTVCEGAWMLADLRSGYPFVLLAESGRYAFLLMLAFIAAFVAEFVFHWRRAGFEKTSYFYGGAAALVAVGRVLYGSLEFDGDVWRYLKECARAFYWPSLNCLPLLHAVMDAVSIMTVITLAAQFARRTIQNRRTMDVLRERGRLTLESYKRLLNAEEATRALRHEIRHHIDALSGILDSGDVARASRYVAAVAGEFERLPVGRYSQNMLVNVIAGSYLDRAKALGIATEHRLNVPPELGIADEDLSVFLSNMLQNALEACERMDPGAERYIRVEMHLRGNFLFVKCVNSAPEESAAAPSKRPGHGYGMAAMRRVAEKYGSVLMAERTPGEFSLRSNLCLNP